LNKIESSSETKKLIKDYPNDFKLCVSHTTRKKRKGEIDSLDYYFLKNSSEMVNKIKNNEFLECIKSDINDCYYGTSYNSIKTIIEKEKKCCVVDVNLCGIEAIHNNYQTHFFGLQMKTLFITTTNDYELETRLRKRNSENEKEIEHRIEAGKKLNKLIIGKITNQQSQLNDNMDNSIYSKMFDTILFNDNEKDFEKFYKNEFIHSIVSHTQNCKNE
jgi:guanylate kinase